MPYTLNIVNNELLGIASGSISGILDLTGTGITSIADNAFIWNTDIISLIIPNTVTSIGTAAFHECTSISTLTFQVNSTLTRIADNAFTHINITILNIPNNVISIGNNAFLNCYNLSTITFDSTSNLQIIGTLAFVNAAIESIVIPASVLTIGTGVFTNCNNLSSITFEDNYQINSIGPYAFSSTPITTFIIPTTISFIDYGCFFATQLQSITIPSNITYIGTSAFGLCQNLTSIIFESSSVITLDNACFSSCTSLNTITIPSSVTSIGRSLFAGCTSLASVNFENIMTTLSERFFVGCIAITSFTIPSTVTILEDEVFASSGLTSISIPNGVISVGVRAFRQCLNLSSVTFMTNSQVAFIKEEAFQGCALLTITIPSSVTNINEGAFADCASLASVIFSSSGPDATISSFAFSNTPLTSVSIPKKYTNIAIDAFKAYGVYDDTEVPTEALSEATIYWNGVFFNGIQPNFSGAFPVGTTITYIQDGGSVGDPYVTTIRGIKYKLPTMNMPIRFYQGMIDGKQLTVNAQLRCSENYSMIDANIKNYFRLKNQIPKSRIQSIERGIYKNNILNFFEKVYINYDGIELILDIWNNKFKVDSYTGGRFPSSAIDGTELINISDIYKNYSCQTVRFAIGKYSAVLVSLYEAQIVKNGIFIEAPNMSEGNGIIVNVLSRDAMSLDSLTRTIVVKKRDYMTKEIKELFIDKDGYRVKYIKQAK